MENKNFIVINHPLVEHNFSILRDKKTDSEKFRSAIRRISAFLFAEATKNLKTKNVEIETPLEKMTIQQLDDSYEIVVAPILRAGLAFCETALDFIPTASIQHIGMYRDEKTLQPIWYFDKTRAQYDNNDKTSIFILDPMLATGNSAVAAIQLFVDKNIPQENITFVSLISAPEGVKNVLENFPNIKVYTAAYDRRLNQNGYILPGLGDAGDRIFNTMR